MPFFSPNAASSAFIGQVVVHQGNDVWLPYNQASNTGGAIAVALSPALPGNPLQIQTTGTVANQLLSLGAGNASAVVVVGNTLQRGSVGITQIGECDASGRVTLYPSFLNTTTNANTPNTSQAPVFVTALSTTGPSATRQSISTDGYSSSGDGGGGLFIWDSSTTLADDGGTVIQVTGIATGRWLRSYPGTAIDIRWFGCNAASVDNSAALNKVIASKDSNTYGAEILVPGGTFKSASAIDLGTKRFTLRGIGYHNTTSDIFGSPSWGSEVLGSVLQFTAVTDGLVVSANNFLGSSIRDIAIIGPGSGTTVGVNFSAANVPFITLEHVGIFNFGIGFNPGDQEEQGHTHIQITGCGAGIKIDGSPTNCSFFNTSILLCNDGILASTGELIKFYGGLVQSCLRGINLSGGTEWGFDNIWFEGNGDNTAPTTITTTAANFTQPAQGATVTVQMGSTAGLIAGQGCTIAGGGAYAVASLNVDGIHATIVNLFNGGNAAPTTVINSGAAVSFGAPYAGPDVVLDISTTSVTNLSFTCCRFASDWFSFYLAGSTGTVDDITLLDCLIGQTLTIPARWFNVFIKSHTAAIINNSTGPVVIINGNDNGTVTDNAGGVMGFGISDPVLGDFVPIIGSRLASTTTELGLGCTQTQKYTKFYSGTTAYLGIKRDSSNIHMDVLDATAGGFFLVDSNANHSMTISCAGSGASIFTSTPDLWLQDQNAVSRAHLSASRFELNAPLAGMNQTSTPFTFDHATPPTTSGANHNLSAAEYTCPNIRVGAATLSGTGTSLTFPNADGLWLVDTSAIVFGGNTFTLISGSGAGAQVALTSSSKTLFWVQCTGANDIRGVNF